MNAINIDIAPAQRALLSPTVQLACLLIVATYLAWRMLSCDEREDRINFIVRFLSCAVLAWLAEDSAIRLYGFYSYAPQWWPMLDKVPLTVALIWPVVIHSGWDFACELTGRRTLRLVATAGIVLLDAALIEPIAVAAGFWTWTHPGIFGVPLIGIAGWSAFAGLAAWALFDAPPKQPAVDTDRSPAPSARSRRFLAVPLVHAALLALWWGGFRLLDRAFDNGSAAVAAVSLLGALALIIRVAPVKRHISYGTIFLRAPGAAFFFALLAFLRPRSALLSYALAFALPYVVLLTQMARDPRRPASPPPRATPGHNPAKGAAHHGAAQHEAAHHDRECYAKGATTNGFIR